MMSHCKAIFILVAAACFFAGQFASAGETIPDGSKPNLPAFGIGQSSLKDARAAGQEAAQKSKLALGNVTPQVIVVFAARPQLNDALIEGISAVFDKSLIYGCECYSPLTAEGNYADQGHSIANGVAVMALGGVNLTIASADAQGKNGWEECGKTIGRQLLSAVQSPDSGKLIITFGNQHVGQNQPFLNGLFSVIPNSTPIVGAAAGGPAEKEIVAGKIVAATNIAILLTGNFSVQMACNGGADDLVAKASRSFQPVADANKQKLKLVMVFDCGGRRENLFNAKILDQEFQAMKTIANNTPLFGFYGGGEIGAANNQSPSQGVGFSIATASISVK